jgi:hypothetical protein
MGAESVGAAHGAAGGSDSGLSALRLVAFQQEELWLCPFQLALCVTGDDRRNFLRARVERAEARTGVGDHAYVRRLDLVSVVLAWLRGYIIRESMLGISQSGNAQQNVRVDQTRGNRHLVVILIDPFASDIFRERRNSVRELRQGVEPCAYFFFRAQLSSRGGHRSLASKNLLHVGFNLNPAQLSLRSQLVRDFDPDFHALTLARACGS